MYEISLLGDKYMDSIGVSNTNSFAITGLNPLEEHWFSVRSVVNGSKGRRAIATYQTPAILNCNLNINIAVDQILNNPSDFTPCADLENKIISTLITNNGVSDNISNFELSYQLNDGEIITEAYTGTLQSGEQVTYDFITPLEVINPALYTLQVSANLADDENEFNDMASIEFFGALIGTDIPFEEDFESNGITPPGWSISNNDELLTWEANDDIIGSDGEPTTAVYINNWEYNAEGEEDELITEYFDLTEVTGEAELNFDLAKVQWNENFQDSLHIELSIDCGESFTTVYEKEDLELSTQPDYNTTNAWEPENAEDWKTEIVDLAP